MIPLGIQKESEEIFMLEAKITNPQGIVLEEIYSTNDSVCATLHNPKTGATYTLVVDDSFSPRLEQVIEDDHKLVKQWHCKSVSGKLFHAPSTGVGMMPPHVN